MHYFTSTDYSITLFGFLYSLAFNNRIENLTLITKFRGALRQCLFCLQVAPALIVFYSPLFQLRSSRAGAPFRRFARVPLAFRSRSVRVPFAFRSRSVRVPLALRSRSARVPSTMNWT